MIEGIRNLLASPPGILAGDALGCAALLVLAFAALHLPVLL